ncbi:integrase catalytic domain-containing protein [Streptomyces azureus]|uniref:Integrase catalytic domain-containing protein n=1 Tax=Streptomyces azureus TaxID=146537 RepID=A0A0K8PEL4_STRAJ|nr:helix-turn-helix domain-containing protein [Streptomyces azureus]GAP46193.1 integrase catalytic domain-containing protein [Streptomyces azureus]
MIAQLVQADEDTVREVIHRFNELGLACLDPRWAGGRPSESDAELDRIEHVLEHFPDRVFALDEFGPLQIRPTQGSCWAEQGKPDRLPATHRRTHGVTYVRGCYSAGDDRLWSLNRRRKGTANSLATLRQFTPADSHHRSHPAQTRALHRCLRRRNTNARHPDVLAAQRRERARIRSQKGTRWGGRPLAAAA